jgi:MFS family permease
MSTADPRTGLVRNPPLLCGFHAMQMSLFPMAIITLFWKYSLGMSMTEIMLLQAIFGGTVAAFEFPSGYVADRVGHRRTLILGSAVNLVAWSLYSGASRFGEVVLAEVLLGIGLSLISGADSALLYESLVEAGREETFARWHGRFRFFGQGAEGSAALVAGVLFALWPRLPFVLQICVWGANLVLAWLLVEPSRRPAVEIGHWDRVRWIVRHAARESPRLRAIIFLATVLGMASFIPVWLIALYAEGAGVPVAWLGPIWASANYAVAVAALASDRVGRALGLLPTLLLCVGLVTAGYLGLGLSHALLGFLFYFCFTVSRGLFGTLLHHEEQRLIPSSDRASFISLRSLVFRGTFLFVGPAVGVAVDAYGMHAVLLGVGMVISSISLLGWLWLLRSGDSPRHTGPGDPRNRARGRVPG